MSKDLLEALNGPQAEAVTWTGGPMLVLAGAGSGKTRVIVHRLAWLVREGHARPEELLAVTFTNRAAREMCDRLAVLLPEGAHRATVTTFHSACARWLRRLAPAVGLSPSFSIWDEDDRVKMMKELARERRMPFDAAAVRQLLSRVDRIQDAALTVTELQERVRSAADEEFAELYRSWLETMRVANAVDFGSLITHVVHALERDEHLRESWRARSPWVMVDEFQDTNVAQYRLVRALAGQRSPVTVVGDDDQSIYRWRGATVENVRRFVEDYAPVHVVKLEENYRSTMPILEAAHRIVQPLEGRMDKRLFTRRESRRVPAVLICRDDREEADRVVEALRRWQADEERPWSEHAIFYRTNAQSRAFEERLRASRIPYRVVGSVGFFEHREIRDVLAWLRMALNPADDAAFLRVANLPPRGIGSTMLEQLRLARLQHEDALQAVRAVRADLPRRTSARTKEGLSELERLLELVTRQARELPAAMFLELVLQSTSYLEHLREREPDSAEDRIRNVQELINAARDVADRTSDAGLERFVEEVALFSAEQPETEGGDAVQLMTVHTAKGLEFDRVVVTGLEAGLFPLVRRDAESTRELEEEERRLCYVALTRAREELLLTAALQRRLYGQVRSNEASPFLRELVPSVLALDRASVVQSLDWRSGAEQRQADRSSTRFWDEFDQRPWEERAQPEGREEGHASRVELKRSRRATGVIPEEGVVFDERFFPVEKVEAAERWVGKRARHATFGEGEIVGAEPVGERVRLTIRFAEGQSRKVISAYVTLLEG